MQKRLKWKTVLGIFCLLFAVQLSAQTFADFNASGSGRVVTNCVHTLSSGCTVTGSGTVSGTPIAPTSSIALRTDTGSPTSINGPSQGLCIPASGMGSITETGGSVLNFNVVGTLCEEGATSGPYHFKGAYRFIGGTGRFINAIGVGRVSAAYTREGTFTRGSGDASYSVNGSISF